MSNTLVQPYVVDSTGAFTMANITVTSTTTLSDIGNVKITGGTSGQTIVTDGTGNLSFTSAGTSARTVGFNLVFGG